MLQSEKITLRAIEKSDLATIAKWRSDPSVYDYFYEFLPISECRQEQWYAQQLERSDEINFAVADPSGLLIGTVSLYHIDRRNRKAEWGRLLIGHESAKNKGIAGEITRLIAEYAFDHLNLHKLYCEVLASNGRVIDKHKQFGFQEEAILRRHIFKSGAYADIVILSLFEDAYRQKVKAS